MPENGDMQRETQEVPHGGPSWRHGGSFHFIAIVVFVAAADFLFYRQPVGCSLAVYSILLLLGIMLGYRHPPWPGPAIPVAIALLGLILALLESPGILPIALGAIGLISLALIDRDGWSDDAALWIQRWFIFLKSGWLNWRYELKLVLNSPGAIQSFQTLGAFLCKWLLPIILSVVFIVLFAIANPVIEYGLTHLEDAFRDAWETVLDMLEWRRILLWLLVAIWGVALLRLETRRASRGEGATIDNASVIPSHDRSGPIVRCLLLFNSVFAVQTCLDITYLWGGADLPEGMTYASYAHRGAYPLVVTALLAALFVLVAFRSGERSDQMRTARQLVYLWLVQNLFLVFSAVWRLHLYIEVYSLTRLRVAAAIWMGLIVMGLVWICWRIVARRSNRCLVNVNVLTLLSVLYVCSFLNFDGMIALYNVHHCKEITGQGAPIDLRYLQKLGPESLPALRWLLENTGDAQLQLWVLRWRNALEGDLAQQMRNWRGWCYRRHRLARGLEIRSEGIRQGP